MNKICTSLEQSKKLMELGIDVNTADMYFCGRRSLMNPKETEYEDYPKIKGNYISFDNLEIFYPAWSLSALLGFMPKFTLNGSGNRLFDCRDKRVDNFPIVDTCPLDAAYNMVILLIEQGYIKTEKK